MSDPTQDLYLHRGPVTALRDVADCKRVLTEDEGSCTWWQAWQLHRARVSAHTLLHKMGMREGEPFRSRFWLVLDWVGFVCSVIGVGGALLLGEPPTWLTVLAAVAGFALGQALLDHYRKEKR